MLTHDRDWHSGHTIGHNVKYKRAVLMKTDYPLCHGKLKPESVGRLGLA